MRDLHARASPCNTGLITRNEMRSAVRVRSSALYFSCKSRRNEKPMMLVSRALSAVRQQ
jgi:hypothetical protein